MRMSAIKMGETIDTSDTYDFNRDLECEWPSLSQTPALRALARLTWFPESFAL